MRVKLNLDPGELIRYSNERKYKLYYKLKLAALDIFNDYWDKCLEEDGIDYCNDTLENVILPSYESEVMNLVNMGGYQYPKNKETH